MTRPCEIAMKRKAYDRLVRYVEFHHPGARIAEGSEYVDFKTPMNFISETGVPFSQRPDYIKAGKWIPSSHAEAGRKLARRIALLTSDPNFQRSILSELDRLASQYGGKLVPGQIYVNSRSKLRFLTSTGIEFQISSSRLKLGSWSPSEGNTSEHICRQAMEHLFQDAFPSNWRIVKRPNGQRLELDGYCANLNIAFEYNGYFTHRQSNEVMGRDAEKLAACKAKDIVLVVVGEFAQKHRGNSQYVITKVADAIRSAFENSGRMLPTLNTEGFKIDRTMLGHGVRRMQMLKAYVATNHPGCRVEEGQTFLHCRKLLWFVDALGYRFQAPPSAVLKGHWSPYEIGKPRDPDFHQNRLSDAAERRGGYIVDGERYHGTYGKLACVDVSGNLISLTPNTIRLRSWSSYESPFNFRTDRKTGSKLTRSITTKSCDEILLDVFEGVRNFRIREHVTSDGLTKRVWDWKGEDARIALLGRPTLSDEFRTIDDDASGKHIAHLLLRRLQRAEHEPPIPDLPPKKAISADMFMGEIAAMVDAWSDEEPCMSAA